MTGRKRKRNDDKSAADDKSGNPIENLNSKKKKSLQKNVWKLLKIQRQLDKRLERLETQQKLILEQLQKNNKSEEQKKAEEEKKHSFNSHIFLRFLKRKCPSNGMSPVGRSFVLKDVFENVSKFKKGNHYYSYVENHFGVVWNMLIIKKKINIGFYLMFRKQWPIGKMEIDINLTLKLIDVNGNAKENNDEDVLEKCKNEDGAWGLAKFISVEELKKDFLVNDNLTAEIHVEINKMTGLYKENLRSFDESAKEVSDVALVVGGQKFYVSKLFLAAHSSFFKALFLGKFKESEKPEIELMDIAPEEFQNYLEVLYGHPSIDVVTVEGILLLADMFATSIVIGKCEDFLIDSFGHSDRKKLQIAHRFNLKKLKDKCMAGIKTKADIKSVFFSGNQDGLDPSIVAELLKKSLSL